MLFVFLVTVFSGLAAERWMGEYNKAHLSACGDVVHAKIPGAACCGDDVFYSDRQTCHDGKPVDKNMTQSK